MNLAIVLFLGGAIVIAWIYFWSRQQSQLETQLDYENLMSDMSLASAGDAVLVAQQHGKLLYANAVARQWLGDGEANIPRLEQIAQRTEPSDNLLMLLVKEGQSSFQLDQRWIEASSHRIPTGNDVRTVIIMRELRAGGANAETLDINLAMSLINQIGEAINASMGLQQVLPTILSVLQQSVEYDAGEINLWVPEAGVLRPQGWVGDSAYVLALAETGGSYRDGEGISGWIMRHNKPILITDSSDPASVQPKLSANNPYNSFVGVPLKVGDRFIGTLELASMTPGAFTNGNLSLLQAISKSVASLIYNVEIYSQQVRRLDDLASLQSILDENQSAEAASIYAALNQRVARLLSADMCGIFLYDQDRGGLAAVPPFHGLPESLIQSLFIAMPPNSPQRDIWERQSYWVSNDVADEPLAEALGLTPIISVAGIVNSAWFPLQISNHRIGVIVVSNKRTEGGFTARDLQHLGVLSSQAAIVIENLRLLEREQRMDTELIGLQELTNAIGALSHEAEFYGEITGRIAQLMEIEMCGILLYDEERHRLVSQLPFFGVEDDLIRNYVIDLQPGSVMEQLWDEDNYWYTNHVQADSLVYEAGLDSLAEQIGVHKTLIASLVAGGRKLGVVQVSNKRSGHDFDDSDARLLLVFATQTASIIQNARLYREAQRSADQAQGLRRVAELAGNVLTTQDTFTPVLAEISGLTNSAMVFVNVLNQQTGNLVTYPRWVYGIELSEPIIQDVYSEGFEYSPVMSLRPFISNNVLVETHIIPSYRQVAERFKIKSAIQVPLVYGDRTLGELGVANRPDGEYTQEDLEMMQAIAAQAAAALDRLLLYEATGQNLNRRLEELDAISRVSNELTLTLNLEQVLEVIRTEAVKATRATDCTVVMLKPTADWLHPNIPEIHQRLGPEIATGLADIEEQVVLRGVENILIHDYQESDLKPTPTDAASAIAASITYLDQVVGVMHIYHDEPSHFDDQAAAFLMTLAVKASLGYGNASRYEEQVARSENLRRRVDQLNRIFEFGQSFQGITDPVTVLDTVAYGIQQSVGFDSVLMLLREPDSNEFRRVAQAGLPIVAFEESRNLKVTLGQVENLLLDDYLISKSYFFPVEKVAKWYVGDLSALTISFEGNRSLDTRGKIYWHDGDMLLVPLMGASGQILGIISLDRPFDNRRPDQSTVEILEIFANQAAISLENTQLYQVTLRNADQEVRLNEMTEAIASTLDIPEIVEAAAEGLHRLIAYDRVTVAVIDIDLTGFDITHILSVGDRLDISRERRSTLGNSLLLHTFEKAQDQFALSTDETERGFDDLAAWQKSGEHVSVVLPLLVGGDCLGAIHIGSDDLSMAGPYEEFRQIFRRVAQMLAAAIQNARLFDQAVSLQVLNRSVVESIQQGIIVLDNSGRIISVNEFMGERFGWQADVAGSDLFDYQPDLADKLASDLRLVLELGEPKELHNLISKDRNDEEMISNFYLYPLRFGTAVRGAVILVEDVTARAKLEQAIQARADQLAALTDISNRVTAALEREDVVNLTLNEMEQLVHYDAMTIWRRHGSHMFLEGSSGSVEAAEAGQFQFAFANVDLVAQVVEAKSTLTAGIPDDSTAAIPLHRDVMSWMGVPLVNQGHVVGLMMLSSSDTYAYESPADKNVATAFASQVAIAQANAELFEQTFDRTNELETLLEAAQATSLTTDLDSVFETVVSLMFNSLAVDRCIIMIWNEIDHNLEVQIDSSRTDQIRETTPVGTTLSLDQYPARMHVIRDRTVVVISTSDDETKNPKESEDLKQYGQATRMLVPLVVRERSIGLIQLDKLGTDYLQEQQVRIARGLGTQVAVAIENARLSAETAAHFEESLIINELSHAISSTLDLDAMVDIVCKQVPKVTNARELYVALYDPKTLEITFPKAIKDGEAYEIPQRVLGNDEVSFIIKHRRALSIGADIFSPDELRKSLGITNGEGNAKSYMGVPLMAGDEVYGVLAVRDEVRTRAFTVNEQRILNIIGPQLGAAIQNARLFEQISNFAEDLNDQVAQRTHELQNERDRIDTLYQITSELSRTLDMERLMPRALGMVAKAVNAEDGVIMQLDPITDQLFSRAALHSDSLREPIDGDYPTHPAEHVARWLIEEDAHVEIVNDLHDQDYWDLDDEEAVQWHSAIAVMLETNEELLGVMVLLSREPEAFQESHLRLLVAASNQVAASINNAELYKLIRDQAERLGTLLRQEQEEAEKNKAILEGIADGVILADANDRIILFNTAAERILQVPRIEAVGQSLQEVTGIYAGAAGSWAEQLEQQIHDMTQGRAEFIDQRVEINGRNVSVHLSPVYTGDKLLGTVSVFRDITREVQADRSKSEFISNVSHEFRTPLTPIKGYIDMVLMGAAGDVSDGQKQILDTVKRNVDRLAVLVDDVLRISELDRGARELTLSEFNLDETIEEVIQKLLARPRHKDKKLDMIFQPGDPPFMLLADQPKVIQILHNLIDNAISYTKDNGEVEINIAPDLAEQSVMISIRDTGVGIPEEFHDRIWERFERHDESALTLDVAGTGLGLPIVKELVELHRGQISFESQVNVGTTFFIKFPIRQIEAVAAASGAAADDRSNGT